MESETRIGDISSKALREHLASTGIGLRIGVFEYRLQSPIQKIAEAIHTLYGAYPLRGAVEFPDFRLRLDPAVVRAKRSVVASVNGQIWHIWPSRLTVAAMEWICSWCFFRGSHRWLAVHAAAAAIPGANNHAVLFPGTSGAGKSTLASTLMMCDWELLSDEIALIDVNDLTLAGLGRPTILKGESIGMMKERYGEGAVFGPAGRIVDPPSQIAHLRPTESTVAIGGSRFLPSSIVLPNRQPDSGTLLEELSPGEAFRALCQFGINYPSLGRTGFDVAVEISKRCPIYRLTYGDAADAEKYLRDQSFRFVARSACAGKRRVRHPSEATGDRQNEHAKTVCESAAPSRAVSSAGVTSRVGPRGHVRFDYQESIDLLRIGLEHPDVLADLSLRQWDLLFPFANHVELLPRLASSLRATACWESLPDPVRARLENELLVSGLNATSIRFELTQLARILAKLDGKFVLLKGAAYLRAGFPWAEGRRTSDVDLLVDESRLASVESALVGAGYGISGELSPADCRYYKRWLHELHPMKHSYRQVEVDVHFRLLPVADPCSFAVDEQISRARRIRGDFFFILDPVDRVLHSIVNLARTGEFRRAFRDVWDLRCMIQEPPPGDSIDDAGHRPFDWSELVKRSRELRLSDSVALILLLAEELVELKVPESALEELTGRRDASTLRKRPLYRIMRKAAMPSGPYLQSQSRRLASWAMEHYPLPKPSTWLDPLTWTKRVSFLQD